MQVKSGDCKFSRGAGCSATVKLLWLVGVCAISDAGVSTLFILRGNILLQSRKWALRACAPPCALISTGLYMWQCTSSSEHKVLSMYATTCCRDKLYKTHHS
jgi:hypothetical protein